MLLFNGTVCTEKSFVMKFSLKNCRVLVQQLTVFQIDVSCVANECAAAV